MTTRYDPKKVESYREAAIKLHEETLRVDSLIDDAAVTGDLPAAKEALDNLTAQGEEVQKLRDTLTPSEVFIAKYGVEVINSHAVSFVIPKGVSRYEILQEAQGIVQETHLIYPDVLTRWATDLAFTQSSADAERFVIDGHVAGSEDKSRAEQEELLKGKKLPMAKLGDLAVAFAAHFVATGQNLFEGKFVRAVGGGLCLYGYGLDCYDLYTDSIGSLGVTVASRGAPELKKLDSRNSDSWLSRLFGTLARRG